MVNYRIDVVHSIANRTFLLQFGVRDAAAFALGFGGDAGDNFMLVGINNVLPGNKTEQYRPCEKNIYPILFQNKLKLLVDLAQN